MPTISRRLASAGTADPGDLKSPSLPGASPGSPTGVWLIGNSRPVRFKIEQPWECKSPHADQFGMSTGRASRACLLNSALLETGVWCKSTAFRHFRARSSKRAGGLIPRIALDQCRVPERYRTRAPFPSLWCSPANTPASHVGDHRSEAGRGRQFLGLQSILSDALPWYGSQFGAMPGGGSKFRTAAVEPAFRQAS